ncbi:2469_t:CDS:2 [Scutellospora calospora]|uniref:2469_t:CDS:1 n=1 Tax=Scutellospora calospora TaxID=85575 RepID=A0ACA9KC82_9GLOM|nr:2469_t:CDS:2 [Scutellospora calospora]
MNLASGSGDSYVGTINGYITQNEPGTSRQPVKLQGILNNQQKVAIGLLDTLGHLGNIDTLGRLINIICSRYKYRWPSLRDPTN